MFAIDTNILAYAAFAAVDERKRIASDLIAGAALADCILPIQVLVEFANASLKRRQLSISDASQRVAEWSAIFPIIESTPQDVLKALEMVAQQQLSWFDALIIATASRAGATVLLTEDMHDGATHDRLRIVNPFSPLNRAFVAALLTG